MGALATLSTAVLAVAPGDQVTCQITVRNTGTVVDQFTAEVIGDAQGWTTVEPATVSLFPGAEQQVEVRFAPPRAPNIPAGPMPFGVKFTPKEDPEGSTVEEGTIEVAAFADTTAELLPRTSRGRRGASHELAIDNRGNAPLTANLSAFDADELLLFAVEPSTVTIEPGHATFARVKVRPRRRFWRGPPQTRAFQTLVEPEGQPTLAVDGTLLQEPLLPKWLPKLIILLLLATIALLALWFGLLRPSLESAARRVAQEEVEEVREQAQAATQAAEAAATTAGQAQTQAEEAATQATQASEDLAVALDPEGGGLVAPVAPRDFGEPFDFRLSRSVVAGGSGEQVFTIPDNATFALTDLILQNPQGDRGTIEIRRRAGGTTTTVIASRLENFRDLDFHYVSPIIFRGGESVVLFVSCQNPTVAEEGGPPPNVPCNAAASLSGLRAVTEDTQ
jgi:hypothetical protein